MAEDVEEGLAVGGFKSPLRVRLLALKLRADQRFGLASHFFQFAFVGGMGTVVNLAVVTLGIFFGFSAEVSVIAAILVATVHNFLLNRHFTFLDAKHLYASAWRQFFFFCAVSSVGILVNLGVSLVLIQKFPLLETWPQLASMAGILAGMIFNFLSSRFLVFRKWGL